MEAFARALRQLPTIIADNGGHDSSELIPKLRACHHKGQSTMGLDMDKGEVGDMRKLQIVESYKCKSQVVISAHEAAEMILRVDEIITNAPRLVFATQTMDYAMKFSKTPSFCTIIRQRGRP